MGTPQTAVYPPRVWRFWPNSRLGASMRLRPKKPSSFKDWKDSIPGKPTRPRRRLPDGSYVPIRNTASRANAKSKTVTVKHGALSQALREGRLDLRSAAGRVYAKAKAELIEHLGPHHLTRTAAIYVDHAARLVLISMLLWAEMEREAARGRKLAGSASLSEWRGVTRELREAARTLGLARPVAPVASLDEYLRRPPGKRKLLTFNSTGDVEDVQ